ncbi:Lcl domain-containing protein [Polaribacter porphyrae]|uniref:Lcl C-terminal domain-containing protein n=1 Tax=Polaribacter porphyrae TaxID=1137780 RepID=A0A2S7WQ47_9FLAO|nr:DUF1566 domain-containing protein [Polaribacter porphyrae]PQJ79566.1 hypothetical protein BTO18_10460 [Polaribacter porphyrae]
MKKITLLLFLGIGLVMYGQTPEKISFQAVVRNADQNIVGNKAVGFKLSILSTSVSGTVIYSETHTPTTNINGLVSLEIGTGSVVMGNFSTIDWGANTYYVKTEIDLDGGTNYTISGTSQLLSVPYALHAKKAENVFSGNYDDLTNKPKSNAIKTYKVGDFAHGGVVFWVDETEQHGLVCSKINQSNATKWFAGTFGNTHAKGNGLFSGKANNSIIIATHASIGDDDNLYAARLCNELEITENSIMYGDWYLPSKYELNLIFQNLSAINATAITNGGEAFTNDVYWSSTEETSSRVWVLNFANGQESTVLKNISNRVRAIRSF